MKYQITFEIADDAPMLDESIKNIKDSLHEALCLAIHEQDEIALDWLTNYMLDISDDEC